jgi:hypothetical protein
MKRRVMIYRLKLKYNYGDQINKGKLDGICSTHERDEKCMQH